MPADNNPEPTNEVPPPPRMIKVIVERECEACGAPLGLSTSLVPEGARLSERNLRDDEISENFWARHPDLVSTERSKKVYRTCRDCDCG